VKYAASCSVLPRILLFQVPITRRLAVLQASMPAAVVTTVLAVQYDLDRTLISGTVVLSTLLSPLTLTPLIAYLLS
jgi:predicted permease